MKTDDIDIDKVKAIIGNVRLKTDSFAIDELRYLADALEAALGIAPPEPEVNPEAEAGAGGTEAAIQLAEENDIDINTVQGTGVDGRVTVPDVRAAIAAKEAAQA